MKNIVFLDEYSINGGDLSRIKSLGNYTGYDNTAPDEVVARAKDAEIVILNKVKITDVIFAQLPKLKLICVAATGVDNVDVEAASKRGIQVKNAKGYSTHSVAETTLGGAIGLLREIVYYDAFVKDGHYASSPLLFNYDRPTYQLHGRKWGIIGLGSIGHEVARLAEAFGCEIAYHSVSGIRREEKYPHKDMKELLGWADILSLHVPLNDKTRDLIAGEELGAMKSSSIIINVARGGIVNERALAAAIDNGQIAGAVVDVFSREPITEDNPLLSVRDKYRLLLSPHNAWSAAESINNLISCISENIENFIKNK